MSKLIATTTLAAALAATALVPAAQADRFRHHGYHGTHHSYYGRYHHHRHGYWHNGRWIALGILGAAAVDALDRDCYWRHGRRYCD